MPCNKLQRSRKRRSNANTMHKNAMFHDCTRPPMFMGVPCVPFFGDTGGYMLLAAYPG